MYEASASQDLPFISLRNFATWWQRQVILNQQSLEYKLSMLLSTLTNMSSIFLSNLAVLV